MCILRLLCKIKPINMIRKNKILNYPSLFSVLFAYSIQYFIKKNVTSLVYLNRCLHAGHGLVDGRKG